MDPAPEASHITVRFSLPLPDLPLLIPHTGKGRSSSNTLTRHLKATIRTHVPSEHSDKALRLIHAGRVLEDDAAVLRAVGVTQSISFDAGVDVDGAQVGGERRSSGSRSEGRSEGRAKVTGKGKERILVADSSSNSDSESGVAGDGITLDTTGSTHTRIYIHCSIAPTVLTAAQLAAEARPTDPPSPLRIHNGLEITDGAGKRRSSRASRPSTTTTTSAATQGFDRLLAGGGFTRQDVAGLRAQFRGIVAARHTPDTMPSGPTLLGMEERWLDEGSFSGARAADVAVGGAGAGGEGMGTGAFDDEDAGAAMWDTLLGVVSGFFWPMGALMWGLRGEGIWSRRRGLSVLAGVGVNLAFGLVGVLS